MSTSGEENCNMENLQMTDGLQRNDRLQVDDRHQMRPIAVFTLTHLPEARDK
jgi:hypothetical protein